VALHFWDSKIDGVTYRCRRLAGWLAAAKVFGKIEILCLFSTFPKQLFLARASDASERLNGTLHASIFDIKIFGIIFASVCK